MYFFYFYPLGLDRPVRRTPWVTRGLEVLMVLAFGWLHYAPWLLPIHPWSLAFLPGNAAPWTVVTAVFLHLGWIHLLGNLVYFHVFGPPLEDRLGPVRFLVYVLLLGAAGNTVHGVVAALGLMGQGGLGVLGASGAIAGMLAFSLVRFHDARLRVGWWVFAPLGGQNRAGRSEVPVTAAVGAWLVLQVVQALAAGETGSTTSFGAHFGGFAMGLFLALVMGQRREARIESLAAQARRHAAAGRAEFAVGAWQQYLELAGRDDGARLELARVRFLAGQRTEAAADYRSLFAEGLETQDVDALLALYQEIERGPGPAILPPDHLAKAAYYREKAGDDAGALSAYEDLLRAHPDHPQGHRALVRVIVMLHGRLGDPARARAFLAEAAARLPDGGWRSYLEAEFSLAPAGGGAPSGPPAPAGR